MLPLVKQELRTLPEHPSSPPDFSGACVTRSLVLCVMFLDCYLSFWPSIYGFEVFSNSSCKRWLLKTPFKAKLPEPLPYMPVFQTIKLGSH